MIQYDSTFLLWGCSLYLYVNSIEFLHISSPPKRPFNPPHPPRYDVHSTARMWSFQAAPAWSCKARSKRWGQPKLGAGPAWWDGVKPPLFSWENPAKMEDLPGKHEDLPRKIGDVVDLPLGIHTKKWGKPVGKPVLKIIYYIVNDGEKHNYNSYLLTGGNPGNGNLWTRDNRLNSLGIAIHVTGPGISKC